jgi:AbrB family looped-hinge helix DNA binding protein
MTGIRIGRNDMARRSNSFGTVGRRGAVVLPAELRKRLGFGEGTVFVAEEVRGGILLRRARVVPISKEEEDRRDVEEVRRRRADPANLETISWATVKRELKTKPRRRTR